MQCPRCRATMIAIVKPDGSDGFSCPYCAGVERAIALQGSRACPDCSGLMDQLTEYGDKVDKWTCKPCSLKRSAIAAAESARRNRRTQSRAEWLGLAAAVLASNKPVAKDEIGDIVDHVLALADERFGEK